MPGLKTLALLAAVIVALSTIPATGGAEQLPGPGGPLPMEPHFAPLPGLAVGVLVRDAGQVLRAEGRFGPGDAVVFGRDNASYRWVYVPAGPKEAEESVYVLVGQNGERTQRFTGVVLATTSTLRAPPGQGGFALVEAEVNGGLGSPPVESFVATRLRVLDQTPEYPLDTARIVETMVARCRDDLASDDAVKRMFESLVGAAWDAAKGVQKEILTTRVTWLAREERLRIECLVRVSHGEYRYGRGVARQDQEADSELDEGIRYGRQVGVTATLAFEADKAGRIEPAGETAPEPFTVEIPPPGGTFEPQRPSSPPGRRTGG